MATETMKVQTFPLKGPVLSTRFHDLEIYITYVLLNYILIKSRDLHIRYKRGHPGLEPGSPAISRRSTSQASVLPEAGILPLY